MMPWVLFWLLATTFLVPTPSRPRMPPTSHAVAIPLRLTDTDRYAAALRAQQQARRTAAAPEQGNAVVLRFRAQR